MLLYRLPCREDVGRLRKRMSSRKNLRVHAQCTEMASCVPATLILNHAIERFFHLFLQSTFRPVQPSKLIQRPPRLFCNDGHVWDGRVHRIRPR